MSRAVTASAKPTWPPELRRAQKRLGATIQARGKWLLVFARGERPLGSGRSSARTEHDRLRWEALAFAMGRYPTPARKPALPLSRELEQAESRVRTTILNELRDGGEAHVEARWRGRLWMFEGSVYGDPVTEGLPFLDAFMLQAFAVLSSLILERRRLRFCPRCRQPFVATRRQRYDTASCSQAHRTTLYRERHRDKLRAYRRRYYRDRTDRRKRDG